MAATTRNRCLVGGAALRLRLSLPCVGFAPPKGSAARSIQTDSGAAHQRIPFWKLVEKRRSEASRSVLFSMLNQDRCQDLVRACQSHGAVSRCFYYSLSLRHFALVEFANLQSLQSFMQCVQAFGPEPHRLQVPTLTRMVHMTGSLARQANKKSAKAGKNPPCVIEEEASQVVSADSLQSHDSIGDQILAVYENQRQTELSTRLRFYICSVLEEVLCGRFLPYARILPFGSSLSGLGRRDTDLDMTLILDEPQCQPPPTKDKAGKVTFHFMAKAFSTTNDRHLRVKLLDLIFNVITYCIPQMHSIQSIQAAKVPIIKFRHDTSRFECDLSIFTNYGTSTGSLGMASTEMLYILGEADARFRPLTFALRLWAKENHVTREGNGPSPQLTNFQLALLAVHFLQMKRVLPVIETLVVPPVPGREYAYGQNYSFMSDYSRLPSSENQQVVGDLFEEFFNYYATFDFSKHAVTVLSHSLPPKDEHVPLLIINPQEPELNVAANVNAKKLQMFQQMCWKAADTLNSLSNPTLSSVLSIDSS